MKKIRVKYLAGITLGFLGITFLTTIIFLAFSNTRVLPWGISAMMVFFMLIGLSTLLGLTNNYDFKKKFGGEIIDENQFLRWSNILETRWIVTFIFQIIFIALNPILMKYIVGFDIEGIDKNLPPLLKFFLTFSPTLIFIFGGILWKINKSDEELIKLKRRERIRTSDLYELIQKVDFEDWIQNDPILQKDRKLLREALIYAPTIFKYVDITLKVDKSFILEFVKADLRTIVLLEIYSPDFFQDRDIVIEYLKCFPSGVEWVDKSFLSDPEVLGLLKTAVNDK